MKRLLLSAILFLATAPAAAAPAAVELRSGTTTLDAKSGLLLECLEDPAGVLDADALRDPARGPRFTPIAGQPPNFGFTRSVYWLRFRVRNLAGERARWLLELRYPSLDHVAFHAWGAGGLHARSVTGRALPFAAREIPHRNFLFHLPFDKDGELVCLLRVKTGSNMSLPVSIVDAEAYFARDQDNQVALGLFYGALLVMVVYNLLLFASFRDKTYLYYTGFLVNIALVQMGLDGMAYQYLWPGWTWWNSNSLLVFICLSVFSIVLFEKEFLFTRESYPRLDRTLNWLGALQLTVGAGSLFLPYADGVRIVAGLAILSCLFFIGIALYALGTGNRPARLFLLAWIAFMLGGLVLNLRSFGILPHNVLTMNGMQIGITLLVVLISLALAERIALLRSAYGQKQTLDHELEIARSVQDTILTPRPVLESQPSYGIDVRFLPMNGTVSGDYYHGHPLPDDGFALTVADASGHGVQAALITMQVDMLCRECQALPGPAARLRFMNRTWLARKAAKSYVSCFTADLRGDRLAWAKAGHPAQFLVRAATGEIEQLGGRGPLLGFAHESGFEEGSLRLEPGDLVLLFSDGVLEQFNPDRAQYGESGLLDCLRVLRGTGLPRLDAAAVNTAILADLERFRQGEPIADDITLLAVRVR